MGRTDFPVKIDLTYEFFNSAELKYDSDKKDLLLKDIEILRKSIEECTDKAEKNSGIFPIVSRMYKRRSYEFQFEYYCLCARLAQLEDNDSEKRKNLVQARNLQGRVYNII